MMYAVIKTKTGAKIVNLTDDPEYFKKGNSQSGANGITLPNGETLYSMTTNRATSERHLAIAEAEVKSTLKTPA